LTPASAGGIQKIVSGELKRKELLGKSSFRSRFKFDSEDFSYVQKVGLEIIRRHARDFILKRLAPAFPLKDGKQTPFRGHPVFKAQHATAICCRSCLSKWYRIPKNRPLTAREIDYLREVLLEWIVEQAKAFQAIQ